MDESDLNYFLEPVFRAVDAKRRNSYFAVIAANKL